VFPFDFSASLSCIVVDIIIFRVCITLCCIIYSGITWVKLKFGPAGGGSRNFVWGGHGECGKEWKGPTFEKFSGDLTLRSLLLDIMSIIRSAIMAVCWSDRSGHHIQRSGHGLTWPNGRDATDNIYVCMYTHTHTV